MKPNKADSRELVRKCCLALEEKKAGELRVIDVEGLSSITDYLIVATATSEPHVRALRVELEKVLDSSKTHIVGVETASESGWTVMDAFDVMIHIFTPEMRTRYRLEHLWRDGDEIAVADILNPKKAKAAPRKVPKVKKKPISKAAAVRKKKGR